MMRHLQATFLSNPGRSIRTDWLGKDFFNRDPGTPKGTPIGQSKGKSKGLKRGAPDDNNHEQERKDPCETGTHTTP
jgi:hypothetical protein